MGFEHATAASQGARNYQEDAATVREDGGGEALIAVLADGMGGHAGGAVASAIATQSFLEGYLAAVGETAARLDEALGLANGGIADEAAAQPVLHGMGCTLVGMALAADGPAWRIEWISVGDSPLYVVREGAIARLNEDHSLAPEIDRMAELGHISWEEALADHNRHVLRSAVTGSVIELIDRPHAPIALEPHDTVVLASDGIHTLRDADIARIVTAASSPAAAAKALLAAVESAGDPHQDNTTVVVVRRT